MLDDFKHKFKLNDEIHGEKLEEKEWLLTYSAFSSLRIALRAYFSTYENAYDKISLDHLHTPSKRENRLCWDTNYQELYTQIVFHFHHFFELLLKDELRKTSELLTKKTNANKCAQYFKSKSEKYDTKNYNQLKELVATGDIGFFQKNTTIEYHETVKRLMKFNKSMAPVLDRNMTTLLDLNKLRNKLYHRGIYVLRYTELDRFIAQSVLPALLQILMFSHYQHFIENSWYTPSCLTKDPVAQIIQAAQHESPDFKRIAFYKAIGKACYNIKQIDPWIEHDDSEVYSEVKANALEKENTYIHTVSECFVCGSESLMLYDGIHCVMNDDEEITRTVEGIYKARCEYCDLLIYCDLENPSYYEEDLQDIFAGNEECEF